MEAANQEEMCREEEFDGNLADLLLCNLCRHSEIRLISHLTRHQNQLSTRFLDVPTTTWIVVACMFCTNSVVRSLRLQNSRGEQIVSIWVQFVKKNDYSSQIALGGHFFFNKNIVNLNSHGIFFRVHRLADIRREYTEKQKFHTKYLSTESAQKRNQRKYG